ncbi:MAG: hypothetical protein KAU50_06265 [Candidatus Marinimicrobia bacterium]|nr:hypothetical protein [Candidatus Neomarinimicrobiota bacterium]
MFIFLVGASSTGSDGTRFTLWYEGIGAYADVHDTLHFDTYTTDADKEQLDKSIHHIKLGLIPYLRRAGYADLLAVDFKTHREAVLVSARQEDR